VSSSGASAVAGTTDLDRGLFEFMYAIPREQLVRPGQRRSLMRRALVGIVPDELLTRKRKAYAVRAPMVAIATEWASLANMTKEMVSGSLGIVEPERFSAALQKAQEGKEVAMVILTRTLGIEVWLREVRSYKVYGANTTIGVQGASSRGSGKVLMEPLS